MTQFIEPNQKSDLKQDVVRDWLSQAFTGILSGLDVSPTSVDPANTFNVNISSGEAWINKTYVDDDETRLDLNLLTTIGPAGGDEHWIIYGSHTPAGTFPPPPMTISAAMTTPPTVPTVPADSVKLADVFVPAGANGIADCTIVKAPKLPARGSNDGDIIIERLLSSNMNVLFGGGGAFSHNGTDTLEWTEDIDLIATTITNKEKFASVPLTATRVGFGGLGPNQTAHGGTDHGTTVVGPNSILFAVLDRLSPQDPNSPTPTGMRVLDLDAPDATEANAFYDPVREKIVFIGAIFGGVLKFRSGIGSALPPPVSPADPPAYFLRNDPGGAHYWAIITEDLIVDLINISQWVVASGDPVELGDNVVSPTFTATVTNDGGDGPDVSAVLTNNDSPPNGESKNVLSDFGGSSTSGPGGINSDFTYLRNTPGGNGSVVFTLTVVDNTSPTPVAANVTLDWWRRTYYGVTTNSTPDRTDDDFLKTDDDGSGVGSGLDAVALVQNPLRSGKGITINVNPVNQYVYFAYPTWKGLVSTIIDNNTTFDVTSAFDLIGNIVGGSDTIPGVTTENAAMIGETYYVYRSLNLQNGNVNITVS